MNATDTNDRFARVAAESIRNTKREAEQGLPTNGTHTVLGWLLILPIWALWGWSLSTLWGWYAVPLGAPHVGWAHAAGLLAFCRAMTLTIRRGDEKKSTRGEWSYRMSAQIVAPLMFVGIGAFFRLFL